MNQSQYNGDPCCTYTLNLHNCSKSKSISEPQPWNWTENLKFLSITLWAEHLEPANVRIYCCYNVSVTASPMCLADFCSLLLHNPLAYLPTLSSLHNSSPQISGPEHGPSSQLPQIESKETICHVPTALRGGSCHLTCYWKHGRPLPAPHPPFVAGWVCSSNLSLYSVLSMGHSS